MLRETSCETCVGVQGIGVSRRGRNTGIGDIPIAFERGRQQLAEPPRAAGQEVLGGVPQVVLADRMGCLKAGVVANVVVPTADYVRFATHYGFRPDFCNGADPQSKGMVENLVGYAKTDLMVPRLPFYDLWTANDAAEAWCAEVNAAIHSEICAVPLQRLARERELLRPLPSLRPEIGVKVVSRK